MQLLQKLMNRLIGIQKEIIGNVQIGEGSGIMHHCLIYGSRGAGVTIGRDVSIAPYCVIMDSDHNIDGITNRLPYHCKKITIGDGVWIGTHCVILKGVNIGKGAVIGAGSIVTKDIPPGEVWAGNPAKKIRRVNQ